MARVIEGLDKTLAALKEYYPATYKEMNKEIRPVMRGLVRKSQALVPESISNLSSWSKQSPTAKSRTSRTRAFPAYNPEVIRKGITYTMGKSRRQRNGYVTMYTLLNKSAVGAIVETAGRKRNGLPDPNGQSNNPNAGQWFINAIAVGVGRLYKIGSSEKQRGRLIFQAFDQDAGAAQRAIVASIEKAKAKTQDKINKAY